MYTSLIELIKLKNVLCFFQNNVVGKEKYLVFLCSEKLVKICHNNQDLHDYP